MEQQTNQELQEQNKQKIQELKEEVDEKEEKIQEMTVKFDSYLKEQECQLVNMKDQFTRMEELQRQTQSSLDLKQTVENKLRQEIEYLKDEKIKLQKKINQ